MSGIAQDQTVSSLAHRPVAECGRAEKVGDGTWKWKDPQGKTWVYHSTPFGYSRSEEVPEKTTALPSGLRVVEVKNGKVTFEQATPFGKTQRVRPISELDGDDKAAYEAYLKATSDQSAK